MSEMKTTVTARGSQSERYLVIEVRWTEVFPEFVIAYRDEESLRARLDASNAGSGVSLAETGRVARAMLQHAIAVGVVMFCSRSMLGAAIRACVGA